MERSELLTILEGEEGIKNTYEYTKPVLNGEHGNVIEESLELVGNLSLLLLCVPVLFMYLRAISGGGPSQNYIKYHHRPNK